MPLPVERIIAGLHDIEDELAREAEAQQQRWHYRLHRGRVWFDRETRQAHHRLKLGIPAFIWQGSFVAILTAPIIYSLIVPLLLVDAWVTLYQLICFPIYGIARVRRRSYFALDRHKLAYLNGIEKLHCTYCSYANGLFSYVSEVAARTEQYWCPIKHGRPVTAPHHRYHLFFDYGDARRYRNELGAIRKSLVRPDARQMHRSSHGRHTPNA